MGAVTMIRRLAIGGVFAFALMGWTTSSALAADAGPARWKAQAARVTITRDDWGIAHIHGKSDADAVFGMMYAQAEDDFPRVEANYVNNLGLAATVRGEEAIWSDLRARLYADETDLKAKYRQCPPWLQSLMIAWADGLNYYLATHKDVHPAAITHFEPWMTLSFSEGSIGGDIEDISLSGLQAFYGQSGETKVADIRPLEADQRGSNGIAIAPQNTVGGHALLLINPHTSFYFRSEAQVTSDAGLNAYGASTWGQFFVYQGFNAHAGWMHTTSGTVRANSFRETIVKQDGKLFYRYGAKLRPVETETITVPYRAKDGSKAERQFNVYRTHHGPIIGAAGDHWLSFSMMDRPVAALQQSYLRTKAVDYASFRKVAELKANSSNDTLFADAKGEIAYMHPHFVPRRDDRFDYSVVVDGADPATDWTGLHRLDETPIVLNPANGWVYNTNNWPYSAAGASSPRQADYPRYMDHAGENPRGLHAVRLLSDRKDFTLEGLLTSAYDPYQPAMAAMIPHLVAAWDAEPAGSALKIKLAEPIAVLRGWDYRWSKASVPMSLAQFWGDAVWPRMLDRTRAHEDQIQNLVQKYLTPQQQLALLSEAVDRLTQDFGTWNIAWGEVNRYQRLTSQVNQTYRDDQPSLPVGFASSRWGSLAAFEASRREGTKRYYGASGNSFVAVVEFGPKVRAIAVSAGGQSGHVGDKHFTDQAQRYGDGALRPVYFYPDDLKGHVERVYRPGQ